MEVNTSKHVLLLISESSLTGNGTSPTLERETNSDHRHQSGCTEVGQTTVLLFFQTDIHISEVYDLDRVVAWLAFSLKDRAHKNLSYQSK